MAVERIREIRGRALPLRGDNIDTDRIMPARFLRAITFEGLEAHLFEDDIRQAGPGGHPLGSDRFAGATILVVNQNFGCGSSREHAPQALRRRGFRALVGESFSEIFFGNAVALGMPCVTMADPAALRAIQDAVEADPSLPLAIDLEHRTLEWKGARSDVALPGPARDAFLHGTWDATGLLLDRFEDVEAVAARLPYLNGWR